MSAPALPSDAALIVIDVQNAIDDPKWGPRNNPGAEANIAALLQAFRRGGHATLVVAGVLTHNSVEATVRMAGNLGFDTLVVADATWAVEKIDGRGRRWPADDVHALSLANMDGEYARVVETAAVLAACADAA